VSCITRHRSTQTQADISFSSHPRHRFPLPPSAILALLASHACSALPLPPLPKTTRLILYRRTGRTLKQGFVTLPMVEVQLEESEISHQCPHCEMFEQVGDAERFKRCQKCKKRYYVSRRLLASSYVRL